MLEPASWLALHYPASLSAVGDRPQSHNCSPAAALSAVFWKYFGSVLAVFWHCVGSVLTLSWQCLGSVLAVSWQCLGSVLTVFWQCFGSVLDPAKPLKRTSHRELLRAANP